jgi:hypothetical protein
MGDSFQIERLYSRWRRLILLAERLGRSVAERRAAVAQIEAELFGMVLFVLPKLQGKPNPYFKPGEKSRRCRTALLQGSDDGLAWLLPMVQSGGSNGDWLCDTDHAVEDLDGDRGLAALSIG